MKMLQSASVAWAALALLIAPAVETFAQGTPDGGVDKPVVTFATKSFGELMGDVRYLTRAAGQPDAGGMIAFMAQNFTKGLDPKQPLGGMVTTDGVDFKVVGFVPVTDLDKLIETVERQGNREVRDAGDGVLEIEGPQQSVFIKEQAGWAFVANSKEALEDVPADPAKIVKPLIADYDVAVQASIRNVPELYREMAKAQLKQGSENAIRQAESEDPENAEMIRRVTKRSIKQYEQLIDEAEAFTIGVNIDEKTGQTYMDITMTALPGTEMAKQMTAMKGVRSSYSGFMNDDATMTMLFSTMVPEKDAEAAVEMLSVARERAMEQIDKDDNLDSPEAKQAAKKVAGAMLDIFSDTIATGKLDGGASVLLDDSKMTLVAGGHVASGAEVKQVLRELVELVEDEPDFPGMQFDAAKHGGVAFHKMTVPVKEADTQKFLGEKLDVVIGTGEKSVYFGMGKNVMDALKKVIDGSGAAGGGDVPPLQMTMRMAPVLKFMAAQEDAEPQAQAMADAFANITDDTVLLKVEPIERGVRYRILVEEGVIKGFAAGANPNARGGF